MALLLVSACHSSKKTLGTLTKEEMNSAKTRYEAVVANQFKYDAFQAKLKYSLGGKSLSGRLTIEHGKRLSLTVTVMGIEVARVEATPEEVMVVDKVDKVYAKVAFAEAAAHMGLQEEAKLETLEALFLGRIYLPGSGEATKGDFAKFAWYPMPNNEMQADYVTEQYQLSYVFDANNRLVVTQVKVPAKSSSFVWEYDSPVAVAEGSVPGQHTLTASAQQTLSAQLSMSSPAVNKKSGAAFRPSDNYRQVSFPELVEIVKNLKP